MRYPIGTTAVIQVIAGAAAVVLGILALVGLVGWTLTQIPFIVIGSAIFLPDAVISTRLMAPMHR